MNSATLTQKKSKFVSVTFYRSSHGDYLNACSPLYASSMNFRTDSNQLVDKRLGFLDDKKNVFLSRLICLSN